MELREALSLLQLQPQDAGALTAEALRKQYLRLALQTHPDKNPGDPGAAARFQALGAAHTALLERLQHGAAVVREQQQTSALLDLLLRALSGEDVEAQLRGLGQYRPPPGFGVDPAVPFDARVPPPPRSQHEPQPDLRQAFREVFQEEGLAEEGDPAGGYELPLEREI